MAFKVGLPTGPGRAEIPLGVDALRRGIKHLIATWYQPYE